jgi:flagellar M-ring protein FliF
VRAIKVLVSGAIGLQPDRGDQLVVESLPFDSTLHSAPPSSEAPQAAPKPFWENIDPRIAAMVGGGGLVILVAMIFFARRGRKKSKKAALTAALPAAESPKNLADRDDAGSEPKQLTEMEEGRSLQAGKKDRLVKMVQGSVAEDPALVAGVLRSWLEEK